MKLIVAKYALMEDGWRERVAIGINAEGIIISVEPEADTRGEAVDIVIPGMPNLHSHAFQRVLAGHAEFTTSASDSFWTWRHLMYSAAADLSAEDVSTIARYLYIEMLKAGYTSVAEFHYLHRDIETEEPVGHTLAKSILDASDEVGIGLTLLPVLYQRSGFEDTAPKPEQARFHLPTEDYLKLYEHLSRATSTHKLQRVGLSFHSLRAVDDEAISQCLQRVLDDDANTPVHIHIAEQQQEVDDCLRSHGKRPVDYLLSIAKVDQRWCLVHATHMSPDEIIAVAKSDAVVGLCPTTEANLGDGIFPLNSYLNANGCYGIGSDSQITVSPCEELKFLEYTSRLTEQRRLIAATASSPNCGTNLWQAACSGGAQALGQNVGHLRPGCRADLLVLDPEDVSLSGHGVASLLDGLIFTGPKMAIQHVMVGGEWVVRDGVHKMERTALRNFQTVLEKIHLPQSAR